MYLNKDGYEMLTVPGEPLRESARISHHRLIAYAHGELASVYQPLEVDHKISVPWLNAAVNLEAVGPIEHGKRTARRCKERKRGTAKPAKEVLS